MPDYGFVIYESLDDGQIVRIMLNRPDTRNAQNRGLHDFFDWREAPPIVPAVKDKVRADQ